MIISRTAPTHSSFLAVTSQRPELSGSDSFADILTDTQSQDTQPVSRNTQAVNFGGRVNVFMAGVSRNTSAVTSIPLTNGLPEGLSFTNAWGLDVKSHTVPTMTAQGLVYETIEDSRYELQAYYDTNSPEDSPVMYVMKKDTLYGEDELFRIEVNKVNPSNASYAEMVALAGYKYRDDPEEAFNASEALAHARDYMEMEGLDPDGIYDYVRWLKEVARRNTNYPNPANQVIGRAADSLLEYLKDYPRTEA